MTRPAFTLSIAVAAAFACVSGATPAVAGPPPPCTFTLTSPQVVQVAGGSAVTATLEPDQCGPPATPATSVACLQMQGDAVKRCHPSDGTGRAQVFFEPFVAGATYVATGRGCGAWIGQPPAPDCQLLGPYSAAL
ncbi:Uncharacterised protein [Mycolicibacterium vanbaalenii]|uniref:Secreted protein n=1 Tax=Mycolicibacterium vanbaalenii TaxID=110539 RepID=A0A5S9R934_MYCVN|nr:hypothetical protein [Mycolicibacterium vanbaalenii]CAA0131968.1 Uncharacterised protein [Mycolicibacterium vanbaalenii]